MEDWLHGVPACAPARLTPHAAAGRARVSLTFRMERAGAHDAPPPPPPCRCGKRAWLKARPGAAAGGAAAPAEYFYTCEPVGGARPCGFWQLAPWAARRAERYLREEEQDNTDGRGVASAQYGGGGGQSRQDGE